MRINGSLLLTDKDLIINSNSQLIFNGNRKSGTNSGLEHTASGNTMLDVTGVISINSSEAQAYKNTNVSGGAILIDSGSSIGLNGNVKISTAYGSRTYKLSDFGY